MAEPLTDLEEPLVVKRPTRWIALAVLLGLLVAGGVLGYRLVTATEPRKVLVAVALDGHWFEGSKPAAILADDLNRRLEMLGFIPIHPGDPEVAASLKPGDDLQAAARRLKASFVVGGELKAEQIQHPIEGGYVEVRIKGQVFIAHVDDAQPEAVEIQSWAGARTAEKALALAAEGGVSDRVAAFALPALVSHPALAELLKRDAKTASALSKAQDYDGAIRAQRRTLPAAYEAYQKRKLAAEKRPVTYYGTTASSDALIGAGASGYLVRTEDEFVTIAPEGFSPTRYNQLEALVWRTPEGGAKEIWSGYNAYGYAGVSADGRVAALSEDLFGWAKTVTVIPADQPAKRLVLDTGEHRYTSLKPSPKGGLVAFYDDPCRECPTHLVVMDVASGKARFDSTLSGSFQGFAWRDEQTLLVLARPAQLGEVAGAEGEFPSLVGPALLSLAFGQEKPKPEVRWYAPPTLPALEWLTVSPDGLTAAMTQGGKLYLLALDGLTAPKPPAEGVEAAFVEGVEAAPSPLTEITLEGWPTAPVFSPDGRQIAFNLRPYQEGDLEVAVLNAQREVVRLTENDTDDRYPQFSPDGKRLYFESQGVDPNFPRREISHIASAAVP